MLKAIPRDYFDPSKGTLKLLWEEEWRGLGITQVCPRIVCKENPLLMWNPESGLGAL
jgi:hypothetical protein